MKVTIVGGAGGVGSSVAFNLLVLSRAYDVVLLDTRPDFAASHVMDLAQVAEQGLDGSVRVGEEHDLLDSDVVVLAAGAPLTANTSRLVYLADHVPAVTRVGDVLCAPGSPWRGVLLMVTNPVDSLCTYLQRRTGLERHRLLGYTLNDSLRLRTGVADALGLRPGAVEAWVLGEHGETNVPLYDRLTVDGERAELSSEQRASVEEFVRTWYVRAVALNPSRSSTWTSGLGVARMVDAIANPTAELWPASVVLTGEYGIDGVSVGVPVTLGPEGATEIHEWELAPADLAALQHSAAVVRELADGI
jgi:malate/lactate dehydrogenase